jgi:hypothetical protein
MAWLLLVVLECTLPQLICVFLPFGACLVGHQAIDRHSAYSLYFCYHAYNAHGQIRPKLHLLLLVLVLGFIYVQN